MQGLGLIIPPLAMVMQLGNAISLGQMLQLLVAAVSLFGIGYILQVYGRR